MRIGLQLYTVRDHIKTREGFADCLARAKGIGYEGVQLSAVGCMDGGPPTVSAQEARKLLDENGLVCAATHRPFERLADRTDEEIAFHKTLGCCYAAIGMPPNWAFEGELDGFRRLSGQLSQIAERLQGEGIRFGYHNHAIEFSRFGPERRTLFSVLHERCSPVVQFELDTYWVVHAGIDLVLLIERLSGRLDVVHLKDKEPVGWDVHFAPVGEGNLDWESILPAFEKAGTEWLLVEQDTCRRDVWDSVRSSFEFLQKRVAVS